MGEKSEQGGRGDWFESAAPALMIFAAMIFAACAAFYARGFNAVPPDMLVVEEPAEADAGEEPMFESGEPAEEEPSVSSPSVFIEVNIPATEMTVFENGVPLFRRRVAIGSGVYPTPALTSVVRRVEWNPWWYPPPYAEWAKNDKPTPPGPGNPLGLVKIPLSGDILFHGTNKEWTVGTPASHGCMRMMNRDATALAWYLQSLFSDKTDPALRETYRKNRSTTYTVHLNAHVPVELVYRPVVARNGSLFFYPDHYNRMGGRRKAGVLGAMLKHGMDIAIVDDDKLEAIVKNWPPRGTRVDLRDIMINAPAVSLLDAPSCE